MNMTSTEAHAIAAQLAFKGIPATEFRISEIGNLEGHYQTESTDFWAVPSVISYTYLANAVAIQMLQDRGMICSLCGQPKPADQSCICFDNGCQ